MSQANVDPNQILREIIQKLGRSIDKIKFNREIPADEADKIRKEVDEVKAELFMLSDINPDIEHIDLFKKGADLVEKTLNILTNPHEHLV